MEKHAGMGFYGMPASKGFQRSGTNTVLKVAIVKPHIMKTSINHGNKESKQNSYSNQGLSVKDALIWFVITVVALCIAGTSHAQTAIIKVSTSFAVSAKNTSDTHKHDTGSALPVPGL